VARIDDYRESLRRAEEELKTADLHRLAGLAGVDVWLPGEGMAIVRVPFFNTPYLVEVGKNVEVRRETDDGEVPLPEKILLCHYLLHASGESPTGELITFREIPDGHFYFDAFQRRARDPFLATFGKHPERFRRCAQVLGGQPVATGDVGRSFQVLPQVAIQLVLWDGDEEFPPDAGILFDASIQRRLCAEDIAVLSGMLVYRLMGVARSEGAGVRE
jgi:hypothetical protein